MAIIVTGGWGGELEGAAILVAGFTSASAAAYLGPTGGADSNFGGHAASIKDQMVNKLGPVTGFWEPALFGLAMEAM